MIVQRLADKHRQVEVDSLPYLLAKGLVKINVKTLRETMAHVKSEAFVYKLAKRLSKWRMKQLGTHFQRWKADALDEKLPDRLAEVKIEILVNTSRSAFSTPLWSVVSVAAQRGL